MELLECKMVLYYRVSENIFETSFPNSPKKRNLITAIPLSFLFWNTWISLSVTLNVKNLTAFNGILQW